MELTLTVPGQGNADAMTVSDTTFGREFNESLVHQVVVAYFADERCGGCMVLVCGLVGTSGDRHLVAATGRSRASHHLRCRFVAYSARLARPGAGPLAKSRPAAESSPK